MLKETFFNQIINNFLEHVFVLNGKEEIVFQTENNGSLLGYSNAEISDHGFQWLFISSHFLLTDAMEKAKKYGEYYCTENFKHKTKEYINIAFRILCYEDQEKKETLYTIYLKDNTQQNIVRKDIIKKSLTIENLSKSRKIRDGRIKEAVHELLESSSRAMNCTRVNAWVLDNEKSEIQCIGNFDASVNTLVAQSALPRIALPLYFKLFETEKIILIREAFNNPKTAELYDLYLKPNDIQSLMDIPVRIEGEMIGVICFENVGAPRTWTLQEQKYGLVAAQMLSLTIESHNKRLAKNALEIALTEQTVLLREVNHRVKNNLAIVGSLLNMQSEKSDDDYHKQLFMECRNRIDSIASVHELLYKAKSYAQLNFKEYLNQLVDHISESYKSAEHIKIIKKITDVHINIAAAIPLGLIVNELITNAYKHAFTSRSEGQIEVVLLEDNNQVFLTITDNGHGFDKTIIPKNSIGMDILGGLIEQIDGIYNLASDKKGTQFKISFSKK